MRRRLSPIQSLALGFTVISFLGGLILSLPVSSSPGKTTPYLDALFTATSAITTTGLIVVDTGSHFSVFGQIVIMILFQIGGLGYMLFFVLFALLLGKKLSIRDKLLLEESIRRPLRIEVTQFSRRIILFTFLTELAGAIALTIFFSFHFPLPKAIYSALFHSISAFNTAGFSIYQDSFSQFNSSIPLNTIVILIFSLGGLGFWVVFESIEFVRKELKGIRPNMLSLQSRIVYLLTFLLLMVGTVIIFYSENWARSVPVKERLLESIFQSLTASSTTGFNTIDIGRMSRPSLLLIIGFMIVGAGSGSTGGGIKLTTLGVLIALIYSVLREREDVNMFGRRIRAEVLRHSVTIVLLATAWLFLATLILSATERGSLLQVVFEISSALGTVGLSMGITGNLSSVGKILIIMTMLVGRVGPLSIGLSVLNRQRQLYRYPRGNVYVG